MSVRTKCVVFQRSNVVSINPFAKKFYSKGRLKRRAKNEINEIFDAL